MHGQVDDGASGFFAHSCGQSGKWQTQREHLSEVARIATERCPEFLRRDVRLAALFHDFGKYSPLFQRRLEGKERGLDHWTPGAYLLLKSRLSELAVSAVHAHHVGLAAWGQLSAIANDRAYRSLEGSRLTLADMDAIRSGLGQMRRDGFVLTNDEPATRLERTVGSMLDARTVLSALVHADYTDTARHMSAVAPPEAPALDPGAAFEAVQQYVLGLPGDASPEVRRVRADLWIASLNAAERAPGLFELEAPTGSGKTLAMLAFALRHMAQRGKRRLIVALPFLSILDQTVDTYRKALKSHAAGLLEHHGVAEWRQQREEDGDEKRRRTAEALSESWDAPIIVTTTVQLLESMFTAHPGTSRKLCALADSVILLDEAQSLPQNLVAPTLKALSRLAHADYGATIVVATATQPLFSFFEAEVAKEKAAVGWTPSRIADRNLNLYGLSRRYQIDWTRCDSPCSLDRIAEELAGLDRVLAVVNTKRDARTLAEKVRAIKPDVTLRHLSTNMCSAHRRDVLGHDCIHDRSQSCILIATQCVEAGVDIDFPVVYRSLAPLPAIAQAAGRCNRNGLGTGIVRVFLPEGAKYPGARYERGAQQTLSLRATLGDLDPQDPELFERYFRLLYPLDLTPGSSKEIETAIMEADFPKVDELYRLIERKNVVHVVVPYGMEPAPPYRATAAWFRSVQPYTVDAYREPGQPSTWLGSPIGGTDDWFILWDPTAYNPVFGLNLDADLPVC